MPDSVSVGSNADEYYYNTDRITASIMNNIEGNNNNLMRPPPPLYSTLNNTDPSLPLNTEPFTQQQQQYSFPPDNIRKSAVPTDPLKGVFIGAGGMINF